jgi:hypothetical protein
MRRGSANAALGAVAVASILALGACTTETQIAGAVIGGATIIGGQSPTQEIEQIYYLGNFDPQGQLPPTLYRIIVRGQASLLSRMKFGSGWVQAAVLDSLGSHFTPPDGTNAQSFPSKSSAQGIADGRRLVLFGPEGFRVAPKDHRLVLVMGSSPEAFFSAIDQSLRGVATVQRTQLDSAVHGEIVGEMARVAAEEARLRELQQGARALGTAMQP